VVEAWFAPHPTTVDRGRTIINTVQL